MRRRPTQAWRLLAVGALAGSPLALLAGTASASTAPAAVFSPGHPVTLTWDRVPGIAQDQLVGAAPSSTLMRVVVAIQDPDPAAEVAYLKATSTKGSPDYHHFLTPTEEGLRFGPAPAVTADVVHRLKGAGLDVTNVAVTGDVVSAQGDPAAIHNAFGVDEMTYRSTDGSTFVANAEGPTVWSGDQIGTIVGLDTAQHWQLPSLSHSAAAVTAAKAEQAQAKAAGTGIALTTTPQDLWNIYQQPAEIAGKGQQLAVIGEGDPTEPINNLANFETQFKLPKVPVTLHCVDSGVSGAPDCGTDTSGSGEWDIDFTASTGMAPDVSALQLYFSQNLADPDLDKAFIAWAQDPNGPRQASASEGVCEQTPVNGIWRGPLESLNTNDNESVVPGLAFGDDQEPVIDSQLLLADMQGKTLFASTGDTGFTCGAVIVPVLGAGNGVAYNGAPSVDYPAASAYAVAVGGTVLYTDGGSPASRVAEYGWNFGGGGTSNFIPAPPWQAADSHVVGRCLMGVNANTNNTGELCRGLPDVAAQSGDVLGDGYDIGPDGTGAGTSLSAPLWQGMWARIQSSDPSPAGYGFAAPILYTLGDGPSAGTDFNDIVAGDNGYPATPGWDYVTGFGTPNVTSIINDIQVYGLAGSGSGTGGDVPEAPLAALIPILGLAVTGGLLYRRRQRGRRPAAV
ncbi:MAG TPA: S53 family peptidase [Acidimicrobiales bacterium]|nr:S53 family peptidase [Acidimicrobiales bacterium]